MKKIFFTPGPSQLFPTVPLHIKNALRDGILSVSHRGYPFEGFFQNIEDSLKRFLGIPEKHHIFFLSSATEAMERIIENCVEKYSFHFVNGSFSERFYQVAIELKKKAQKNEVQLGMGFNFKNIKIPKHTELICFTQNETSTGVLTDVSNIYAIKKQYPEKLVALDIVSSVPYVKVDFNLIDLVFFSVQKGIGLPAGLGVLIVSPKAIEKSKHLKDKNNNTGSYHNFYELLKYGEKNQTPETPNVFNIYLLSKVIEDMLKIGIDKIRTDTEKKANLLYKFFDNHLKYKPFVSDINTRSKTVLTINVTDPKSLIKELKSKGLIVGSGYGKLKDSQIRIANFPSHSIRDIKTLLKNI